MHAFADADSMTIRALARVARVARVLRATTSLAALVALGGCQGEMRTTSTGDDAGSTPMIDTDGGTAIERDGSIVAPDTDGGPCVPTTCAAASATCGMVADGCGGTLDCGVCPSGGPLGDLIDLDRITTWNPGILADTQLGAPLGDDGLPVRTTVCATLSPGDDIAAAIRACPEGQVVQLAAGTFSVSSTITLSRGVVLRGAGSGGAPGGTTIEKRGGGTVLAIGDQRDSICYGGTAYALVEDAAKESTTISVGAAARQFSAGDLALVDIADDAEIDQGDCPYFKRESGRSVSQRVMITAVDEASGTLTLDSPLHWAFRAAAPYRAEIVRVTQPVVRFAGVEHLRLRNGSNPGYNGQMAGGVDVSNAAFSWVKDVQTDETNGGMHVSLTGTYRVVVRDSYFHHSANYGFGADCYGIVLRCGAAENLVENNVVRYMNKPIMFNVSGGGNVIAYNYADNSWATPAEWQEVNIDCHCSFPHMELMEGNFAPHMGATTTHGNAGYLTYFRNYASSEFAAPAVAGSTARQNGNIAALQFQGGDIGMNAIGNVLGRAGVSRVYDGYDSGRAAIFQLGDSGAGASDVAATTLFRHGNYDYVNMETRWDPDVPARALPPSLYLRARPGWWPPSMAWPWAGPDLTPMVGTLPAKARSDAM